VAVRQPERMQPLTSTITINAAAEHVWDIVGHRFDHIGEWATAIPASIPVPPPAAEFSHVPPAAPVAGRVCDTGLRVVPQVTETIVAYDEAAMTLTYEADAGLPGFVTLARNTWQVTSLGDQQTQVTYSGELRVRGFLGVLARRLLLTRVARDGRFLLDDLKHYAEHGEPSPRKRRDPVTSLGARPTSGVLRAALRTNAVFSLVSGLTLAVGAVWYLPLLLVGVPVAGFGLVVAAIAAVPAGRLRRIAGAVVAADILWVVATTALLTEVPLPAAGAVASVAVAAVVALLAAWQAVGLAAIRRDDPLADFDVIEVSRHLPVPPHRLWPLVSDHQLYGRLAPNLSTVEVSSRPGETMRRRCTSSSGQQWQETCTLWDEGRRFAVEVDTAAYPYPITVMRGLWQIDPHPHGSTVTMRFALQARPTIRGGLFLIVMRPRFGRALARIFEGWQREALTTPATIEDATSPAHPSSASSQR
jgi:ribosome-associated toxin RatA of RatAB toxin-antitoxin module